MLGLALDLSFHISVRASDVDGWVVERLGESSATALDLRHDAIPRSLRAARDRWNLEIPRGLAVVVDGDVPRGCGLGSNSADFAAGVGAALRFSGEVPRTGELLELMVELGSDPGHGAAALTGGLSIAVHDVFEQRRAQRFRVLRQEIDEAWRLVVAAPELQTTTADAHRVVPATLPHGVVARTSGRLVGLEAKTRVCKPGFAGALP